ncbi:hypothetical protein [Aporhodopirellula aestuarii]|uniref:Doubled CXXCH motif domain-containing protein n=1 Tax=Aporhodopirellula aestuarii TaxID=2950107 RepID=A0ABT0U704_9BACT|nr:hypothetical protein [Aporhodopirellula aestuarii]MCM2372188.1 hypothetical protein [Aporhodopirellula aestuarii]
MPRITSLIFVSLIASMVIAALVTPLDQNSDVIAADDESAPANALLAESATQAPARPKSPTYTVTIRRPDGPPRIELAGSDPQGRSGTVACSTCHSVRPPAFQNRNATTLDEFHQGMQFNHGTIACYSCHNPDDADSLRLADGTRVDYSDVMTLCSQCHGPQATSFAHGAHGGINGFWDLSRGPQVKNNCVDCHDPHAPAFPKMIVDFKPKDRFNMPHTDSDDH